MCDTLGVMHSWSRSGETLFAKNSDRSPNEPHLAIRVKASDHLPGSLLKMTYITIPEAAHTLEAILFKPSWTWGAEMGVNSASVAIGNEAVFTKAKRGPDALTGMDLVRLALERADSARMAVDCITALLEEYGQGGNCAFDHDFYYDNSFMIVDPQEGYVLETSGRKWAAVRFTDRRSISNRLSIHAEHTMRGGIEEGYDFTARLTEPVYTHFSGSRKRMASTCDALETPADAASLMAALRSHDPKDETRVFTRGSVRSVCMHAGGLVGDHTTGSLVVTMREGKPMTLWCTAASTPCLSAFKPVFLSIDSGAPVFENESDARQYWLERETIHRAVLAGNIDVAALRARRDALEKSWLAEEKRIFDSVVPDARTLADFARKAAMEEQAMVDDLLPKNGYRMPESGRFNRYWTKKNLALGK